MPSEATSDAAVAGSIGGGWLRTDNLTDGVRKHAYTAALGLDAPNPARVMDYLLGGAYNTAIDREFAERLLVHQPNVRRCSWASRQFTIRAARCLAAMGIRQFLDLGPTIAAHGAVHDGVRQRLPHARIAYVTNDPVTAALNRILLSPAQGVTVVESNPLDSDSVLHRSEVRKLFDLRRPIALMIVGGFRFATQAAVVREIVTRYREPIAPGSYFVVCETPWREPSLDVGPSPRMDSVRRAFPRPAAHGSMADLFKGLRLIKPGLVRVDRWRSPYRQPTDDAIRVIAGVAMKP